MPERQPSAVPLRTGASKRERTTGPGRALVGAEYIARRFHELCEELVPSCGPEIQERPQVRWEDVPPQDKQLMVAAVSRLLEDGTIIGGAR